MERVGDSRKDLNEAGVPPGRKEITNTGPRARDTKGGVSWSKCLPPWPRRARVTCSGRCHRHVGPGVGMVLRLG